MADELTHGECAVTVDGRELPARVIEDHPSVGVVVELHRGAQRFIAAREDVRLVTDPAEWDNACEFDRFPAAECVCPPSYVRDQLNGHTEARCPLNVHGPALLAEQEAEQDELPAPSCHDAELPERDADPRALAIFAGEQLAAKTLSPEVAMALAAQLADMRARGGMHPAGALGKLLRRRVIELERYAGQRAFHEGMATPAAMRRAAAVTDTAPEYVNAAPDVLEQLAVYVDQLPPAAECPSCGQQLAHTLPGPVCTVCAEQARQPQGEAFTLFDTAPYGRPIAPPPGQEGMF